MSTLVLDAPFMLVFPPRGGMQESFDRNEKKKLSLRNGKTDECKISEQGSADRFPFGKVAK